MQSIHAHYQRRITIDVAILARYLRSQPLSCEYTIRMNILIYSLVFLCLWVFLWYRPIVFSRLHDYGGIPLCRSMMTPDSFTYLHGVVLLLFNPMILGNYRLILCSINAFAHGLWVWLMAVNRLFCRIPSPTSVLGTQN